MGIAKDAMSTGITPAYAGKSHVRWLQRVQAGDHPRLCGEKLNGSIKPNLWVGSPPPMRGKVSAARLVGHTGGITPAYAGKSQKFADCFQICGDHPRLCGEKVIALFESTPHEGSPPPMRGKVEHHDEFEIDFGITPAYAGKRKSREHRIFLR